MLKTIVKLLIVSLALFGCISNGVSWSNIFDTALAIGKGVSIDDDCEEIFGARICWSTKGRISSWEWVYECKCWVSNGNVFAFATAKKKSRAGAWEHCLNNLGNKLY